MPQTFLIVVAVLFLVDLMALIYLDRGLKQILQVKRKERNSKEEVKEEETTDKAAEESKI